MAITSYAWMSTRGHKRCGKGISLGHKVRTKVIRGEMEDGGRVSVTNKVSFSACRNVMMRMEHYQAERRGRWFHIIGLLRDARMGFAIGQGW